MRKTPDASLSGCTASASGNAQCAMRLRAADMLAVQFVSVNELGGIVEIVLQYVGFTLEPCGAARPVRDFQVARFACVAVDAARVQHAAHGIERRLHFG